ncbi:MAG: FAD-dependent oxidoreductase [Candidatus Atribacteria bacterium]|nr:FAD-dependent oxidoreductase [Candidatus Atribacteria bacterium]
MNKNIHRVRKNVVVVGAGPAGCAASIACSRNGQHTVLIEKNSILGGMSTAGLVKPFMTSYVKDKKVIAGIFSEIVDRLRFYNGALGPLKCPYTENFNKRDVVIRSKDQTDTHGTGGYITLFDPEVLKYVLIEEIQRAGIELVLHSFLSDVTVENNRIKEIVTNTKSGTYIYEPDLVIDATGDGDVAALAGCRYVLGREEDRYCQPVSVMYTLGGIDADRVREYILQNRDQFEWLTFPEVKENIPPTFESKPFAGSGFFDIIAQAKKEEGLVFGRNQVTFFTDLRKGELTINATRVSGIDGTKVEDLTKAEIETRKQVFSLTGALRRSVPGFENCFILASSSTIGVRESRKIVGEYILTKEDVLNSKQFFDSICQGAFPVDIHDPVGEKGTWIELNDSYSIPYRCLITPEIDNLIIAGRCISTTHDAQASTRVMPTCIAIGQAAGTAAAIIRQQITKNVHNIEIKELQNRLQNQGAII